MNAAGNGSWWLNATVREQPTSYVQFPFCNFRSKPRQPRWKRIKRVWQNCLLISLWILYAHNMLEILVYCECFTYRYISGKIIAWIFRWWHSNETTKTFQHFGSFDHNVRFFLIFFLRITRGYTKRSICSSIVSLHIIWFKEIKKTAKKIALLFCVQKSYVVRQTHEHRAYSILMEFISLSAATLNAEKLFCKRPNRYHFCRSHFVFFHFDSKCSTFI